MRSRHSFTDLRDLFQEPRPLWQRVGPNLLALAIVGAGMGGALRIVQAQVTPAPPAAPDVAPATPAPEAPAPPATPEPVAAPAPPASADSAPGISAAEEKRLSELLRQRAQIDAEIAKLRANRRTFRINMLHGPQSLTPDQRRMVDDAMRQAQEAMRLAQKAMEQAMRAVPDAQHWNLFPQGKDNLDFKFQFNGHAWNPQDMQKFRDAFEKNFKEKMPLIQQEIEKAWKQNQPEFERQMRDLNRQLGERDRESADRDITEKHDKEKTDRKEKGEPKDKPESEDKRDDSKKNTGGPLLKITTGSASEAL